MVGQLRDYYLSTLGLVQYVPRDYCRPGSDSGSSTDPALTSPGSAQPVAEPAQSGDLADLKKSVSQPAKSQPGMLSGGGVENTQGSGASDKEDVRFRITCWQPAADIFVVASLEYGQNPQPQQQELLSGILRAIGRLPRPLNEPELLDWPTKPGADTTAGGAKTLFSTFLHARLQSSTVRWVLIMGDIPAQYVLSGAEFSTEEAKKAGKVPLSDSVTAILTPGLTEMLADREHKRATWEAVRFLAELPV